MEEGQVSEKDTEPTLSKHRILSATEILDIEIPDITYYIEGILRPGGKATIVAKKKMGKSFLALAGWVGKHGLPSLSITKTLG